MRTVKTILFFVTVLFLAAIANDFYIFYLDQSQGFHFTSLGFDWTHYDPDSYKWAVENAGTHWPFVNELLTYKTVFVTGAFASVFYIGAAALYILQKMTGTDGFGFFGFGSKAKHLSIVKHSKKSDFHYKKR